MSATNATDPRQEQRHTLMLRTAKVVCQSGEYVCLVRDVSAGGVGLRFLHDVPEEKRIFLELANGALYPIERTWADQGQAGYRFAAQVVLENFLSEASLFAHRPVRLRLKVPVLLTVDGHDFRAMLADISRCGAKLNVDRLLPQGAFARFDAAGLPLRFGHIRWRKDHDHGIVFQEAIPLEELARCLHTLQPCAVAPGGEVQQGEIRAA
ncbi:MAG: PilZ domain-containing protein [Novosphingobium sp.]|uniref:PilZ domain-containing protein n=1 Tax=Novosphingobium sp. TaxID=1874826 RepID=UPI0032BA8E1C